MLRLLAFVMILIGGVSTLAFGENLNEFVSDGCTLFPEGTREEPQLWAHCCFEHDLFYWAGGTKRQRHNSDIQLRECLKAVGKPMLGRLMYRAVRLGRHSPIKIKSQEWGNAWDGKDKHRTLSTIEIEQLAAALEDYDIPVELKRKLLSSF